MNQLGDRGAENTLELKAGKIRVRIEGQIFFFLVNKNHDQNVMGKKKDKHWNKDRRKKKKDVRREKNVQKTTTSMEGYIVCASKNSKIGVLRNRFFGCCMRLKGERRWVMRKSIAREVFLLWKKYNSIEHKRQNIDGQNVEGPSKKEQTERSNRAVTTLKTDICVNPGILAVRARTHDKKQKKKKRRIGRGEIYRSPETLL